MKKAIFVLILVLSVQMAFGTQEVKYHGYETNLSYKGYIAGGIVMMAVPFIPMTLLTVATALGYYATPMSIPLILFFQTTISGALMLHLGVKRYYSSSSKYYNSIGKLMRNAGIIILTSSVVPIASQICNVVLFGFNYDVDIATFVINSISIVSQWMVGAVFLGLGISRLRQDKIPLPEVSLTHDSVSVGLRMRI